MTDPTLPAGGGCYTRLADGRLELVEPPTAREAALEAPLEAAVQAPLEAPLEAPPSGPGKAGAKPMKEA